MDYSSETTPQSILDKPISHWLSKIKLDTVLVILIILAAFLSRLIGLGDRVMAHDEVNHVVPSYNFYQGQGYRYDPVTHGPMQFHLIALSYFLFGDNDFTSRLPHALFSVAAIAVVAIGFRRYLGKKGALIAAFLFLISPYMLFYGRYARNEGFSQLFGVLTLLATLRYLDKGDKFSLFLMVVVTALHFTDKATAYIYTAQLLIFLAILFMVQVSRSKWRINHQRWLFILTTLGALVIVGAALGLAVIDAAQVKQAAAEVPAVDTVTAAAGFSLAHLTNLQRYILVLVGFALALGIAAITTLIRGLGWQHLKDFRSFDLLILIITLIMPLLSALPARMLGWDPLDYNSTTNVIRMAALIVGLTVIAGAVGMLWRPRIWLISAAIFYTIFTLLFTTFFTNGQGFFAGLVGSLGYWLSQQTVNRGDQPLYYYALLHIPFYEYLPFIGAMLAGYFATRWGKLLSKPGDSPAHPEPEQMALPLEIVDESGVTEENKTLPDHQSGLLPVVPLLLCWGFSSLVAYSLAGEKMPWLTVHITLAFILAAGWGIGWLVDTTDWKQVASRKGLLAIGLMILFLVSLLGALGILFGTQPPFQGKMVDQLASTASFIIAAIFTLLSGAGMMMLMNDWRGTAILRLVTTLLLAAMTVLTARSAYRAAFINYDYAFEFLVYAHAADGPGLIMDQVEDISKRLTGGKDLQICHDNETLYPFWWYLRDYPNDRYYGDKPGRDIKDCTVVLVGDNNYGSVASILKDDYVQFDYMRLWWPMMDYTNLTWDRIRYAITDPNMRSALWQIWLNRDYRQYASIKGNTSLTLTTWSPSARMRMYIRKDTIEKLWEYGVSASTMTETVDAYASNTMELMPDLVLTPKSTSLNGPRNMALAPDGTIYVVDSDNHRVLHLDLEGNILHEWGGFGDLLANTALPGTFNQPWGIAVDDDGFVYVADTWNHRIQKFTADGVFVKQWGIFAGDVPDGFWGPRAIAIDNFGRLMITDTGNKRVAVFTREGQYVTQFGAEGVLAGEFEEPVGIAVGSDGKVYIADTWNQRVQVFECVDNGATYYSSLQFDVDAWDSESTDNKPYIAVDSSGNIYITDPEGFRVLEFDVTGQFVRGWGQYSNSTDGFGLPVGILADPQGRIWVADKGNNWLIRFVLP